MMKIKVDAYVESLNEIRHLTIVEVPNGLKGNKARQYARQYVVDNAQEFLYDILIDIHITDKEVNPFNFFTLQFSFVS